MKVELEPEMMIEGSSNLLEAVTKSMSDLWANGETAKGQIVDLLNLETANMAYE